MSDSNKQGLFSNLKHDLPAGIVVFLVAMPLCLGIALASGAPLFSGIIAGIVGGILVAAISGSPLGVSGPAAGLAVIVYGAIEEMETFETFLLAVMIAGAVQLILGLARAGVVAKFFPGSVITGMLSGIGIIIFLKQIPHAFGYDKDPEGDFAFAQVDGHNTFSELGYMMDAVNPGALIIAAVSLFILILWEQKFMKKVPAFKIIQGPLVAVAAGIGLHLLWVKTGMYTLESDQVVNLPVAESVDGFINQFSMPDFNQFGNVQVWKYAGIIALVASLETLLCVDATDKLDPMKRITPTNRELIAQGAGNMVSGLIGGLPITQVIVRSSANIQSGGRTKISAIFHGFLLVICVAFIPNVLNLIPLASLAAILFVVGYKLAKPSLFIAKFKEGWDQFIPFIVTIAGIVFTDLLTGIAIGFVVAMLFKFLIKKDTPSSNDTTSEEEENKTVAANNIVEAEATTVAE